MEYWKNLLTLHNIEYKYDNIKFLDELFNYKIFKNDITINNKYQNGGAHFEYKNLNVTLIKSEDSYRITYSLKNKDNHDCLLIFLDKEISIANISGISPDIGCYDDKKNKLSGSELLDIAIEFIKFRKRFLTKEKKIITIKKIILTDNSLITCGTKRLHLGNLYTLSHGITWYMSRGFIPFSDTNSENDKLLKINKIKNEKIMNSLTVKKSNLLEYITTKIINLKPEIKIQNKETINGFLYFIKNNQNVLLKILIKNLKPIMNDICFLLSDINSEFYEQLGLYDFYGKKFYLTL